MRSITLKLTVGFVIVSLAGMALAAGLIQYLTRVEFSRFLFRQDTSELVTALADHFEAVGSWRYCDQFFRNFEAQRRDSLEDPQRSGEAPLRTLNLPALTLANAAGRIVCGPPNLVGTVLPPVALRRGQAIEVDGETVGYLLAGAAWDERRPLSPELTFLQRINRVIGWSALASIGLALLLGSLLARTLTRTLRELTSATQDIARGRLGLHVPVRSNDELGNLADSFNRMSTDLENSTRLRKQMTADIAHDLRTPLSLILGYTEALSDGKLPGDPEVFTVMHREAQHLNRLIDDLRLLSLADAGELPLNRLRMAPEELLRRAAAAFRSQAEAKGVVLLFEASAALPPVDVDPERISQVLGNLLANALRHTPAKGEIKLLAVEWEGWVLLQVRDNGSGIAPDVLPHIFERFYRGDKSRADSRESGLGLSIARSLVEAHGGTIHVESQPSQGAVFTVRLPAARTPE